MDAQPHSGALDSPARNRDWRVWFGLTSTAFWLCLGGLYIGNVVGWDAFVTQPTDSLGGFLEGAFAPLAFLWLVIGFFLQQRELRNNNEAIRAQYEQMRRTAENAEIQARAIRANALHQQQETTLLVADRVHKQLGAVVGLLWMSSQFVGEHPDVSEDRVTELWSRMGMGDSEAFARNFMALYFRNREDRAALHDLFFGTDVRRRHSETILQVFGRLLEKVRECDPDGMIEDALRGSAHGMLYGFIEEARVASG
jgi:uncharacterized protein YneF (UPF0154 family)